MEKLLGFMDSGIKLITKSYLVILCMALTSFSPSLLAQNNVSDFEFVEGESYKIVLTDGEEFIGRFVSKSSSSITISTNSIPRIDIPIEKIKKVELIDPENIKEDGSYWFSNPNSTRYFFSPSALNLKKGSGYYQNSYLLFNSFNYGLTDNISIGGGFEFISTFSGNPIYYFTPKAGVKAADNLYLGGGVLLLGAAGEGTLGITYGIATFGNRDDNLTAGLGWGFVDGDFSSRPTITVSGMKRLKRKFSFVTENWFVPFDDEYTGLFSYGGRFFGEKLAVDLGFLNNKEVAEALTIGFPYVGFVVVF